MTLGVIIALIIIASLVAPYVYKGIQLARLEQYVREMDLTDGWGESYNTYGPTYHLLNRDDVLAIIEIVKKLKPTEPQFIGLVRVNNRFYIGDMCITTVDEEVLRITFNNNNDFRFIRGDDGLEWPTNTNRIDE